ncbi:MAG: DUF1599 domain-containing protein [Deltaproteobacteria bacterium]|nr:MAG: DUF1599 domain-containing protein [Deltaproteobacteria bacterium]
MTRSDYLKFHAEFTERARSLSDRKNQDYSDDDDAFANLNLCEVVCPGMSCEQGIVVRMSDKLARLGRLLQRDASVPEESIEDTLLDVVNYAVLLAARRSQRP